MNRRTLLAGAGSLGALGAGYAGYRVFTEAPPTPGPVTDVEFDASTEVSGDKGIEQGPAIDTSSTDSTIEVSGAFVVGNECDEATIDDIEHDASSDELIVTFEGKRRPIWERGIGCDDAGILNAYHLVIAVDPMPEVVTAIERDPWEEHRTRVETAS